MHVVWHNGDDINNDGATEKSYHSSSSSSYHFFTGGIGRFVDVGLALIDLSEVPFFFPLV